MAGPGAGGPSAARTPGGPASGPGTAPPPPGTTAPVPPGAGPIPPGTPPSPGTAPTPPGAPSSPSSSPSFKDRLMGAFSSAYSSERFNRSTPELPADDASAEEIEQYLGKGAESPFGVARTTLERRRALSEALKEEHRETLAKEAADKLKDALGSGFSSPDVMTELLIGAIRSETAEASSNHKKRAELLAKTKDETIANIVQASGVSGSSLSDEKLLEIGEAFEAVRLVSATEDMNQGRADVFDRIEQEREADPAKRIFTRDVVADPRYGIADLNEQERNDMDLHHIAYLQENGRAGSMLRNARKNKPPKNAKALEKAAEDYAGSMEYTLKVIDKDPNISAQEKVIRKELLLRSYAAQDTAVERQLVIEQNKMARDSEKLARSWKRKIGRVLLIAGGGAALAMFPGGALVAAGAWAAVKGVRVLTSVSLKQTEHYGKVEAKDANLRTAIQGGAHSSEDLGKLMIAKGEERRETAKKSLRKAVGRAILFSAVPTSVFALVEGLGPDLGVPGVDLNMPGIPFGKLNPLNLLPGHDAPGSPEVKQTAATAKPGETPPSGGGQEGGVNGAGGTENGGTTGGTEQNPATDPSNGNKLTPEQQAFQNELNKIPEANRQAFTDSLTALEQHAQNPGDFQKYVMTSEGAKNWLTLVQQAETSNVDLNKLLEAKGLNFNGTLPETGAKVPENIQLKELSVHAGEGPSDWLARVPGLDNMSYEDRLKLLDKLHEDGRLYEPQGKDTPFMYHAGKEGKFDIPGLNRTGAPTAREMGIIREVAGGMPEGNGGTGAGTEALSKISFSPDALSVTPNEQYMHELGELKTTLQDMGVNPDNPKVQSAIGEALEKSGWAEQIPNTDDYRLLKDGSIPRSVLLDAMGQAAEADGYGNPAKLAEYLGDHPNVNNYNELVTQMLRGGNISAGDGDRLYDVLNKVPGLQDAGFQLDGANGSPLLDRIGNGNTALLEKNSSGQWVFKQDMGNLSASELRRLLAPARASQMYGLAA